MKEKEKEREREREEKGEREREGEQRGEREKEIVRGRCVATRVHEHGSVTTHWRTGVQAEMRARRRTSA